MSKRTPSPYRDAGSLALCALTYTTGAALAVQWIRDGGWGWLAGSVLLLAAGAAGVGGEMAKPCRPAPRYQDTPEYRETAAALEQQYIREGRVPGTPEYEERKGRGDEVEPIVRRILREMPDEDRS